MDNKVLRSAGASPPELDLGHVKVGNAILPLEGENLPSIMAYLAGSLTTREMAVLWRWIDARAMIEGMDGIITTRDGKPRGRYREVLSRSPRPISETAYVKYEIAAYRWISGSLLGNGETAKQAEMLARMAIGISDVNPIVFGQMIVNADHGLIGFGATVGVCRTLAGFLLAGYAHFAEAYRIFQNGGMALDAAGERVVGVAAAVSSYRQRRLAGDGPQKRLQ
jgi:hypothetical protein